MMMFNLFMKYITTLNLILFSITPLLFTDLILIWFFMEISNYMYMCLLNIWMKNKKMIFFYFILQVLASFMIIYNIIMNNFFMINSVFSSLLLLLALMMKLSVPPFHLWLPLLSKYLTWPLIFILITMLKVTPFYMISLMNMPLMLLYMILILCASIPPFLMLNINNLKILLTYSSINQTGWMLMLIWLKNLLWMTYFFYYSMILLSLTYSIHNFKIYMNFNNFNNMNFKMILLILMFNLASMPPFSFFLLKWYSIFYLLYNSNFFMILILLMFSSLIMLYIYTKMMINSLFLFMLTTKIKSIKYYPLKNMPLSMLLYLSIFASSALFLI
uniref:NADH-ubiquinone oxidoreductase chain 2 n=1 Tax=Vollenhovia emeryi TaxID=411798 RepID=A0A160DR37_VOLEM|nr:NADH dehydrogenase subunit 2 [Vollenhovia emeryi]ANA91976.1 NADH dehydrogenase subunit 2 [Vollenhovia emeryi]